MSSAKSSHAFRRINAEVTLEFEGISTIKKEAKKGMGGLKACAATSNGLLSQWIDSNREAAV